MSDKELRAPQILELELAGHTQQQIADTLGVSRMQIYRDRQTPLYDQLKDEFLDLYISGVRELATNEKDTVRQRAIEEMGRSLRAGMPKQIHQQVEKREIQIIMHDFNPNQPTPKEE